MPIGRGRLLPDTQGYAQRLQVPSDVHGVIVRAQHDALHLVAELLNENEKIVQLLSCLIPGLQEVHLRVACSSAREVYDVPVPLRRGRRNGAVNVTEDQIELGVDVVRRRGRVRRLARGLCLVASVAVLAAAHGGGVHVEARVVRGDVLHSTLAGVTEAQMEKEAVINRRGRVRVLVQHDARPRDAADEEAARAAVVADRREAGDVVRAGGGGGKYHIALVEPVHNSEVLRQRPPLRCLPLWDDNQKSGVGRARREVGEGLVQSAVDERLLEDRVAVVVPSRPRVVEGVVVDVESFGAYLIAGLAEELPPVVARRDARRVR
mmetsp:Transcript_4035/g.9738  ORF Transcript_4035/g.9738 Transcript_4035/m.9738 type:complete len:321 (+) Transcript_4035:4473-5435(+)